MTINEWGDISNERHGEVFVDFIAGYCPTQGFGTIRGEVFYFRSRGNAWRIELGEGGSRRIVASSMYGDFPDAGYMEPAEALELIKRYAKESRQ